MYSFHLVIMLACAVAYYHIGKMEYQRGFLLAAISILVWIGTGVGLNWGWLGCLGAQVGIFAGLTILNFFRKPGFK